MEYEQIKILLDMAKLVLTPNISQFVKEKTIKELLNRAIDIQPAFGVKTKQKLKMLINSADNEMEMTVDVSTYILTNNCSD